MRRCARYTLGRCDGQGLFFYRWRELSYSISPFSDEHFTAKGKTKKLYNLPRDAIISFFFDTFAPKITCEQLPFILSTPYYI